MEINVSFLHFHYVGNEKEKCSDVTLNNFHSQILLYNCVDEDCHTISKKDVTWNGFKRGAFPDVLQRQFLILKLNLKFC